MKHSFVACKRGDLDMFNVVRISSYIFKILMFLGNIQ